MCSFYYISITRLPHLMGPVFPYFICRVMIANFKPPFSLPLTYIRPSIPVSQFPVVVPFLPSTRSKAFRLQPQTCNSQQCSSAVQGEFKANSTVVALYHRKYTEQNICRTKCKVSSRCASTPQMHSKAPASSGGCWLDHKLSAFQKQRSKCQK